MSEYILELKDVVKTFGGVKALNGVHFQLKRGEIHALMGENGAGKSTFIKVITGVHQPDSGIMLLDGEQVTLRNTTDSAKLGIAAIYQHVTAFPDLTVTENIFMGREIKNKFGFYDWKTMRQRAKELIQPLSAEIDVNKPMGNLSVAEQQLVEIAKALSCDARILIMDEPTASLTRNECLQLYRIAKDLRDKGVSIIFITHRFEDMYELATRVTVFRDSTYVGSWDVDKITNADLVKAMPGTLTWKERLEAAKAAGYDYVEISIDATEEKIARLDMDRESRLELVKTMYETGIPIRTMCVSALTKYAIGSSDEACCARGMAILEKSLQLADDLGIRVVMIPGYDVYYEESTLETKHRFLENLRKAARLAEKTGVLIGLETMENEFMNTVEKAMKYVTLCGSNYLKVYPDIGNLTNAAVLYKSDVLEDMELGRGNLTSLHLKETVPGKFREIPYGTGHVDFEAAIKKAWDLGVRRFVTEFWYTGNPEWKKDLNDAVKMMCPILDAQK